MRQGVRRGGHEAIGAVRRGSRRRRGGYRRVEVPCAHARGCGPVQHAQVRFLRARDVLVQGHVRGRGLRLRPDRDWFILRRFAGVRV